MRRALGARTLTPGPPYPCPYRSGLEARSIVLGPAEAARPGVYHALMDLNFRRLGDVFYRPACASCSSCRQLRVRVNDFRPSRAQRRCARANADLAVETGAPAATDEKHALYERYLAARHDGQMNGSRDEMESFLYRSCVANVEVTYRTGGRLVGVGLVDVEPRALSAVYSFFDPALASRSLGTFNVLWTIAAALSSGRPFVYLGYWVAESPRMRYKAEFRPCEAWGADGWEELA